LSLISIANLRLPIENFVVLFWLYGEEPGQHPLPPSQSTSGVNAGVMLRVMATVVLLITMALRVRCD
jgi:hypothetical protein